MVPARIPSHPQPAVPPTSNARQKVWIRIVSKCEDERALSSKVLRVTGARGVERHHIVSLSSELAHKILRSGVGGGVLEPLADLLEVGPTQLAPVLGVDRTTARRYAREDQDLPMHSAETVLRLAELEAIALDVFETEHGTHAWLKAPHPMLGESPIEAAATSYGAQRVREILMAIKYGGVA